VGGTFPPFGPVRFWQYSATHCDLVSSLFSYLLVD